MSKSVKIHAKHRVLEDGDTSHAKKIAGEVEINDRDVIQGKNFNMKNNVHIDGHQGNG
jgi:hypothetical protein